MSKKIFEKSLEYLNNHSYDKRSETLQEDDNRIPSFTPGKKMLLEVEVQDNVASSYLSDWIFSAINDENGNKIPLQFLGCKLLSIDWGNKLFTNNEREILTQAADIIKYRYNEDN
jgi:hypothetical protein